MNHTKAEEDLRVITGLLRDWAHTRRISGLEYDLLLDKLKGLYELVRFADVTGPSDEVRPEPVQPEAPASVAPTVAAPESVPQSAGQPREEVRPQAPVAEQPAVAVQPAQEVPTRPAAATEAPAEEKDIHRKTVRALYDDEPSVSDEDIAATLRMMSDAVGAVCCAAERSRAAVAEQSQRGADACATGESMVRATVLGETIGQGGETVADRLQHAAPRRTADVCRGRAASLREMIGLNDRYLLINELFGGDADLYEETIGRLDGMTSIEDAVIWLNDRFHWDGESAAAQLLSDLLVRKLM